MISGHCSTTPLSSLDNPLRRLPGILLVTLLLWGGMLQSFAYFLRQSTTVSPEPKSIEVQLQMLPDPPLQAVPEKPPKIKLVPHSLPPAVSPAKETNPIGNPEQKREQPTHSPSQPRIASQASASPTTIVSLPESNSSAADHNAITDPAPPDLEKGSKIASGVSGEPITPPTVSGVDYLNNPKPRYPFQARRMAIEGTVLLKVLVSREGRTLEVVIVKSSDYPILDEAAMGAVRQWRFTPAHQADVTLEEWVQVPITFRISQ